MTGVYGVEFEIFVESFKKKKKMLEKKRKNREYDVTQNDNEYNACSKKLSSVRPSVRVSK